MGVIEKIIETTEFYLAKERMTSLLEGRFVVLPESVKTNADFEVWVRALNVEGWNG